jgi:hypothetical protein
MERVLRVKNDGLTSNAAVNNFSVEPGRALRIDESEKMREKVDKLYEASEALKRLEEVFKANSRDLQEEVTELREEILAFARERKLLKVSGETAVVVYKPKASRKIDAPKLLAFLKGLGKTADFFRYASVPLKDVEHDYGAAVLESSGILSVNVNEYGNMQVRKATG